ncbi:FecR family protein [Chitinophaga sancti]|uniref:FecR family protein n=1 Tax=Chitinophaga sancti TaxID=1004 RepID=UPI002A757190|nr:FecR family protein [Chitinophaga sancti]WPQ62687.1 FecR family protein [Chitinophaga sancti]
MESSLHEIFRRYVNDDCTEEEISILLDHFNIPAEELLLKDLIIKELQQEDTPAYQPQDTDIRLQKVYQHLELLIKNENRPGLRYYKSWPLKIAAAVLVMIAAGAFWMTRKESLPMQQPGSITQIVPGTDQATLTTGNGQTIVLNNIKQLDVPLQGGGRIKKLSNGQIIYDLPGNAHSSNSRERNMVRTPAGGQWQVVLPDQTHIWLNASSTITYYLPFEGQDRNIELSGEAYFEVSRNSEHPLKITCRNQEVLVLGTAFNIMAYPDAPAVTTTLVKGAVVVTSGQQRLQMAPGDQSSNMDDQLHIKHGVDIEEAISWKDGYFKFNGSLPEIMNDIARWYDVKIVYRNTRSNEIFEGEILRSRSLEDVLNIIEKSGKVHFIINGRTITVED